MMSTSLGLPFGSAGNHSLQAVDNSSLDLKRFSSGDLVVGATGPTTSHIAPMERPWLGNSFFSKIENLSHFEIRLTVDLLMANCKALTASCSTPAIQFHLKLL